MWLALTANLATVALFVTGWNHVQPWLEGRSQLLKCLAYASIMGCGSIGSMMLSFELEPGVIVDLRSSLIAISGFFGGPLASLITGGIAAAFRLYLGGHGALAGTIGIAFATVVGAVAHVLLNGTHPRFRGIFILAAIVSCVVLLSFFMLPAAIRGDALGRFGMPIAILNFAATSLAGMIILRALQLAAERDLLHAALIQSPDFQYIKNRKGEFVAVNQTVATFNGFDRPVDMRGKTDKDIASPARARKLIMTEQELMLSGQPLVNEEERIVKEDGQERWFSTSKSPLHDADGNVIGLAGVTRDITEQKQLEVAVLTSRDQLSYALSEMSDGLAMFNQKGYLVYCNSQYQDSFPLTGPIRVPGVHFTEIMRAVLEAKEHEGLPAVGWDRWVERAADMLRIGGEQEIELCDKRWLRIKTRPTREGLSLVLTSDITRQKEAERVLTDFTNHLKILARMDGLTNLLNRRAFDQNLENELGDAEQNGRPISLLLIDVDHFKLYNDHYGHPAGDDCLRSFSQCLTRAARSNDTVARYGGEEFALILPSTDEREALACASNIQTLIRKLALPHTRSDKGIVTCSIGLATLDHAAGRRQSAEILAKADEALYWAKSAGRDQVAAWRDHETGAAIPRIA